jgi:hypothetical protein
MDTTRIIECGYETEYVEFMRDACVPWIDPPAPMGPEYWQAYNSAMAEYIPMLDAGYLPPIGFAHLYAIAQANCAGVNPLEEYDEIYLKLLAKM